MGVCKVDSLESPEGKQEGRGFSGARRDGYILHYPSILYTSKQYVIGLYHSMADGGRESSLE